MTQPNVVNDLSALLKLQNKVTAELVHKINLCIGSAISDAKLSGDQSVVINIGIGTLSIDLIDMQCKFIPSKDLKTAIKDSLNSSVDPLELELEQALADKLISVCEEVL